MDYILEEIRNDASLPEDAVFKFNLFESIAHENIPIVSKSASLQLPKFKRTRRYGRQQAWCSSKVFIGLQNKEQLEDPSTKEAKRFKLMFRMSYSGFENMLQRIEANPAFRTLLNKQQPNCARTPAVPFKLKVLEVLRVLGRGCLLDDSEEVSNISRETLRAFLHEFCDAFCRAFFGEMVDVHQDGVNERSLARGHYPGLPGCIGSMDGLHIYWDACPAQKREMYKGRYDYPTIAFNVSCDHKGRFISCTKGNPGRENDKGMIRFDEFADRIRHQPQFTEYEYKLYDGNGALYTNKGAYLLCDGGYHAWTQLQCPEAITSAQYPWVGKFFRYLEAQRKDIECAFGRLVKRFRILKIPILYRDETNIQNIFWSCLILHNMIQEQGEADYLEAEFYAEHGLEYDVETLDFLAAGVGAEDVVVSGSRSAAPLGLIKLPPINSVMKEVDNPGFADLRAKLVTHFKFITEHELI